MSIVGALATDEGIRNLDQIVSIVTSNGAEFDDAVSELSSFFIRHLQTGMLPFASHKKYPTPIQRQVYSFIDGKYLAFCNYLNSTAFPINETVAQAISNLLIEGANLNSACAYIFIESDLITDPSVLSLANFQNCVYQKLSENIIEKRKIALRVISTGFPNPHPSSFFSDLFKNFIKLPDLTDDELHILIEGFDNVLSRVDDPLITFDFLHENVNRGPTIASLSTPYLVEVSIDRAVDVPEFYSIAFNSISPESLSSPKSAKFFDMLSRVLSSKTLQTGIPTAFAVKLSRMLLRVPVNTQLDILGLLQYLVRAHECVEALLEPIDAPVSDVDGKLEDCKPQTLWEVRALRNSSVPAIAEAAKTLGQRRIPADFGSFNLRETVETCKAQPKQKISGNWMNGLDKTIWSLN
ncbi:nucleolar complex protein 4 [Histomonas meleagridis]|uniref:nucleolar complex protein 4-like n=1 Tax=Histomonas meleagridis TaxID=135588 RepID=UPI003559EF11|nr:nucleolar complex protein 4 [Histomonas meleagridis]KAH0797833.1 nucleolar complex protein 4-like [Histomonas meleagridis]